MARQGDSRNCQELNTSIKTNSLQYDKGFPFFREPLEIGKFSLDETRQFKYDSSQLKNYYPPSDITKCRFDLKSGYEIMIQKDDSVKEYIDTLLQWIMESKDRFVIKKTSSQSHPSSKEGSAPKPENEDFQRYNNSVQ